MCLKYWCSLKHLLGVGTFEKALRGRLSAISVHSPDLSGAPGGESNRVWPSHGMCLRLAGGLLLLGLEV